MFSESIKIEDIENESLTADLIEWNLNILF